MAQIKPAKGKPINKALGGGTPNPMPLLAPNNPFFLLAHVKRFGVMFDAKGKGHVIPQLRPFSLAGGSNGVSTKKADDGSIERDYDAGISSAKKSGWVVLDPAVVGEYRVAHDVRGGQHIVHMYTNVYPGSNHVEPDRDNYIAWCQEMMEKGYVPEPPRWLLEDLLGRYERMVADASSKRTAAGDRKAAQLDGVVDTLRAALDPSAEKPVKAEEAPLEGSATAKLIAKLEAAEKAAEAANAAAEKAQADARAAKSDSKAAKAKATRAESAKTKAEERAVAAEEKAAAVSGDATDGAEG